MTPEEHTAPAHGATASGPAVALWKRVGLGECAGSFFSLEGTVDFDGFNLWAVGPGRQKVIEEQERLYGTGALMENMHMAAADGTFFAKAAEFESAVKAFRANKDSVDEKLFQSMEDVIKAPRPYVLTKGITVVQVTHYNDIIAATRVLKRLAGEDPGEAAVIRVAKVKQGRIFYKPGVREARPGKITITDARSRWSLLTRAERRLINGRNISPSRRNTSGCSSTLMTAYFAVAAEYFRVQQHTYDCLVNRAYMVLNE